MKEGDNIEVTFKSIIGAIPLVLYVSIQFN